MSRLYTVNEIYGSLQGEGMRAGTFNIFVRFTGCNLKCAMEAGSLSPGGFDCDTEFASGRKMDAGELVKACVEEYRRISPAAEFFEIREGALVPPDCPGVIFTGGEPALQLTPELLSLFYVAGFGPRCIETNASMNLDHLGGLDWITVSPKVAEHAIKQVRASEVKYVRAYGQGIPKTVVTADHYLISPAFDGVDLGKRNLDWCIQLVRENPKWRLSVQLHKLWEVR
jgi:organic radical activating enzyme